MEDIKEALKQVIKKVFGVDFDVDITVAPESSGADYSSNVAMKLARGLHKSPMEIAAEIEKFISGHSLKINCSISVAAPGFLNFIMNNDYYLDKLAEMVENPENGFKQDFYAGQTVVCEFSDPNPFKVLHAGHLYTSVVGDAISRLFENAGAKVVRANFGGDVGLHVAKTLYALRQQPDFSMEDIAKNYVAGTAAYENDENAKHEITELNKEIYKINAEDIHGTELADLYWRGRELSYEYFKDFYKKIGVAFDKFYPESTVAGLGLAKVQEELENGVYEMSDGAVVFRGDKYGLHTRVFINQEGVPTYEAKDVGLIFRKWEDWHFDKSIVITGNEQLDYMKVVLKSIEQYAPDLVKKTSHLTHGLVRLPGNVKMSSRLGNGLKATDVLDLASNELKREYQSDNFVITLGAIKYAFLKYSIGGNIVFDPKESVKMTGCSGPYLQYSCVRAKKIQSNLSQHGFERFELNSYEKSLIKQTLRYDDVLREATFEMAPHKIANYLYELAQEFSRFYEKCPVVGNERESLRGAMVGVYLNVMEHGLKLLGIEIPEEM